MSWVRKRPADRTSRILCLDHRSQLIFSAGYPPRPVNEIDRSGRTRLPLRFGISGTLIALRPRWIGRLTGARLGWLSLVAASSFIPGYLVSNNVPFDPYRIGWAPG